MACVILSTGAACVNAPQNKATNDSAATVDEVGTTISFTMAVATTKPTEQPTTVAKGKEKPASKNEEPAEVNDNKEEVQEQPEDSYNNGQVTAGYDNSEQSREYNSSDFLGNDIDLIARTVYLESGGCGEYCQWLTASTILNLAESRGGIANVVYDYNTFSVADMIDYCEPSDLAYSVAERVASGDRDYNVMAFRADYYHDFGSPYASADNVYFSTY